MQREPHQPEPELEAALHAGSQEVERKYRHRQHPEQGEPLVEPQEVFVEERCNRRLNDHEEDHVDAPDNGDDRRQHAEHEPHDGLQGVEPGAAEGWRGGRRCQH